MKKLLKVLFVITAIVGLLAAAMGTMGGMFFAGEDPIYDYLTILGAWELVGSIAALVMGLCLKEKSAVRMGIVFLVLGAAFAGSAWLLLAPIELLPAGLCVLSAAMCFLYKRRSRDGHRQ